MLNEKQAKTLATVETVVTVVAKLSDGIRTGEVSNEPSVALKHKVASALMKKLSVHLPKEI